LKASTGRVLWNRYRGPSRRCSRHHGSRRLSSALRIALLSVAAAALAAAPAAAQGDPLSQVFSFLLTNRAVQTGDFERDAAAAAATRDTVTKLLVAEVATQPPSLSSVAFVYRFNPDLGTVERASASFGSFFTERSLTAGRGQAAFGVSVRSASYQTLDGLDLRDGQFLTTANQFRDESQPFDVETLTLDLRSRVLTFTGTVGVTDHLDVSAAVPIVSLSMTGQRVNTYRGERVVQATADASVSGLGDVAVRAKYGLLNGRAGGLALAGEVRLPTGSEEDLLGAGEAAFSALVIGSGERGAIGYHGNVAITGGGLSNELAYRAAICIDPVERITLVGELIGRRVDEAGRITAIRGPHPTIRNVDTIRLVADDSAVSTAAAVFGAKWNVTGTWLVAGHVLLPVSDRGLRSGVVTQIGLDYAFGR
jgi:hypothetical protein